MNKTTEALKLAEEALAEVTIGAFTRDCLDYHKALAAVREALAEQPLLEPEGRCKECMAYNDHLDYCSKAKPVKQEPVAWGLNRFIEDDNGCQIGTDDPELQWGKYAPDDNGWWPLYTHPVRTKDLTEPLLNELQECRDLLMCVESCSRNNFENLAYERVQAIDAVIAAFKEKNK